MKIISWTKIINWWSVFLKKQKFEKGKQWWETQTLSEGGREREEEKGFEKWMEEKEQQMIHSYRTSFVPLL